MPTLLSRLEQLLQAFKVLGPENVCEGELWLTLLAVQRQDAFVAMPYDARQAFVGTVTGYITAVKNNNFPQGVSDTHPGEIIETLLGGRWLRKDVGAFCAARWE